jgi:hypothetical protein
MKRSLWSLIMVAGICWSAMAGDKFAVGLSGGTNIHPNATGNRLGVSILGSFAFSLLDDVSISLSSGYMTWGSATNEKYDTRIVPIIFSARYYFVHGALQPYVSGELSYVIGEADWSAVPDRLSPVVVTGTRSISELGSGLGLGIQLPMAERLSLDLGSVIHLTSQAQEVPNIRVMAGVSFGL